MGEVVKLTDKQERFCQEYVVLFNATQAAINAGYSEDTAGSIGHENLKKPEIEARLKELKKELSEQFGISKAMLVNELRKVAMFDIRKIFTDENNLKNIVDFDDDSAGAVAGIEADELYAGHTPIGVTKKVKLHSKIAAIERLSRMLGYDEPIKTESKVTGTMINYNSQPGNEPLPE